MQCPNCHHNCQEDAAFCEQCGSCLPAEPTPVARSLEEIVTSLPDQQASSEANSVNFPCEEDINVSLPKKSGSLWAPILVMLGMFCLGLLVFFLRFPTDVRVSSELPYLQVDASGSLSCSASYSGIPDTVTVPAAIDGRQILSLGDACFAGSQIITAILPQGLEALGNRAFADCTALRGLFLPDSVTSIGSQAFSGCSSLEAICIPNTVTEIGAGIFDGCDALHFVFYSGTFAQWRTLYRGYLQPSVYVFCLDGAYRQNPGY